MAGGLFKSLRGRSKNAASEKTIQPESSPAHSSPKRPSSSRGRFRVSSAAKSPSNASLTSSSQASYPSDGGGLSSVMRVSSSSKKQAFTPQRTTSAQSQQQRQLYQLAIPESLASSPPLSPPSPLPGKQNQSPSSSFFSKRRKPQPRRRSIGDPMSLLVDASPPDGSPRACRKSSARFINSRNSLRKKKPSMMATEEEKKEIQSDDEEEGDGSYDFFESPEFRHKVANEAADLDKEGNVYFERGDYDKAFLSYERALKLKRASLQGDRRKGSQDLLTETESQKASILASVATSINNMTYLRQRAGQASADETMAAYLKSLQIKREILGPNHLSVGKTLNNIGSVFYLKKEFVPALKAYENAYEIMAEQLGETHLDVGTVLSNIGDVHSAMGHRKEALKYYHIALDIRWAQLGRNDPKVVRLMEQTAALETGRQPRKRDDEKSDSEDEEFAEEDRKKRQAFREECRALQEELVKDSKFFDLVERKLTIECVKQKTKFMRAMRQMQMGESLRSEMFESPEAFDNTDFADVSTSDVSSSDGRLSVMSAPPDLDVNGDGEEKPEVLAFLKEIGVKTPPAKNKKPPQLPPKSAPPKPRNPKSLTVAIPKTPPAKKQSPSSPDTEKTSTTPSSASPPRPAPEQTTAPTASKQSSLSNGRVDTVLAAYTPPSSPHRKNCIVPPMLTPQQPKSFSHLKPDDVTPSPTYDSMALARRSGGSLTPDERRMALLSVKQRVATMRSKRQMEEQKMTPQQLAEVRRRANAIPRRLKNTPPISTRALAREDEDDEAITKLMENPIPTPTVEQIST